MSYPRNFALIREDVGVASLQSRPLPTLKNEDYILVRTKAIALNPTDWTTLEAPGLPGSTVGCDFAGVVEAVGENCKARWSVGDRVAGVGHGGNDASHQDGAFARFISVRGDLVLKIPEGMQFEEACSVWSGVATTGYALYHVLGLPWPGQQEGKEGETILIYGGSTATATIAIQFAKMSGRRVVTTCSERHFELMRSRGADMVYDYRTPNVGDQIRKDTDGKLTTVLDCVAVESSAAICAAAIGSSGGTYVNLLGIESPRSDVESIFFLGYSLSGEDYIFEGEFYAAKPGVHDFAIKWFPFVEMLWAEGKWKAHPRDLRKGGLLGALEGMKEMKAGKGPSGAKLVYNVEETEWPSQ